MRTRITSLAIAIWSAALGAHAADEEIQVYLDDMRAKGAYGLDVHVNDVFQGRGANFDFAGQQASRGRLRITPEWAYGLTSNLELGAYLPLLTFNDCGRGEIGGVKGRLKFIAPHSEDNPYFWGVNFELGRVRRDLDTHLRQIAQAVLHLDPRCQPRNVSISIVLPQLDSPVGLVIAAFGDCVPDVAIQCKKPRAHQPQELLPI